MKAAGDRTGLYREPAREAVRHLVYGPFLADPIVVALIAVLTAMSFVTFEDAELSSEVECHRTESGAPPTCERRSRMLRSPETMVTTPAVLRRAGPSGNAPPLGAWIDVLEYDGITLILPNSPPGPLTRFLDSPDALQVLEPGETGVPTFFPRLFAVLAVFFLPRALWGLAPRRLAVDRSAGIVVLRAPFRAHVVIAIDEIVRVRVETFGDDFVSRLRGARVVLEKIDGNTVALAPYARPLRSMHVRCANAVVKALGVGELCVAPAAGLRSSPAARHPVIVLQVAAGAIAAGACLWS